MRGESARREDASIDAMRQILRPRMPGVSEKDRQVSSAASFFPPAPLSLSLRSIMPHASCLMPHAACLMPHASASTTLSVHAAEVLVCSSEDVLPRADKCIHAYMMHIPYMQTWIQGYLQTWILASCVLVITHSNCLPAVGLSALNPLYFTSLRALGVDTIP
jgi:hypothetical protein